MYGSSLLSIIIGFLVSIFNSRVLGPELFGDYKFIETVARLIASVVSVGFFISLTRLVAINKNELNERKYVGLFTIIFSFTTVIGVFLYLTFSYLMPLFFENNLESSIWKYFFIISSIIGYAAIIELLKGLHKINTIAIASFLPLLTYLLLVYTINKFTPITLNIVLVLTYGIILVAILIILFKLKPNFNSNKKLIQELFKENNSNGKPIYFGSLAGVATTHIAGLSISFFMDNTQVGFFMLALTICSPILVIPSVLGTIFYKQFVTISTIPNKVYSLSIISTLFALIVFYSLIEFVIITFYTESYLPVATISKYIIVAFIFHGFGDLINKFLGAKGKGKQLRNAAFLVGFINILGYTFLIKYFDINGAIITKILASCLYLVAMLFYYNKFIKNNQNV